MRRIIIEIASLLAAALILACAADVVHRISHHDHPILCCNGS